MAKGTGSGGRGGGGGANRASSETQASAQPASAQTPEERTMATRVQWGNDSLRQAREWLSGGKASERRRVYVGSPNALGRTNMFDANTMSSVRTDARGNIEMLRGRQGWLQVANSLSGSGSYVALARAPRRGETGDFFGSVIEDVFNP